MGTIKTIQNHGLVPLKPGRHDDKVGTYVYVKKNGLVSGHDICFKKNGAYYVFRFGGQTTYKTLSHWGTSSWLSGIEKCDEKGWLVYVDEPEKLPLLIKNNAHLIPGHMAGLWWFFPGEIIE